MNAPLTSKEWNLLDAISKTTTADEKEKIFRDVIKNGDKNHERNIW